MKPIRLVIAGLHSFKEEQEIDFTGLCQGNVFGIFGPTGSGKSTVVDAITLALYGSVKRASRKTQGIVNKALDEASVLFEFQLGSGAERKHYRVERKYVARDDSINVRLARLTELQADASIVLADNSSQVDQAVREILGLTEDDFTRAVVLPQGRFAEFLNLQGSERRRMLERIFGLEEYGDKLTKLANERLKAATASLENSVRLQELLGEAGNDAVEAAKLAAQMSQKQLENSRDAANKAKAKQEQWSRVRERQVDLAQAVADLLVLDEQTDIIANLEAKLKQQAAAARVDAYLQAVDRAGQRKKDALVAAEQLARTAETLVLAKQEALEAARQASQAKEEKESPLRQKIERLERALELEQQIAKLHPELTKQAEAKGETQKLIIDAEQDLEALNKTVSKLSEQLSAYQTELTQNRIEPAKRRQLAAAIAVQDAYLATVKQKEEAKKDYAERQQQLDNLQQDLEAALKAELEQQEAYAAGQQAVALLMEEAPPEVTSSQLQASSTYLQEAQQMAYLQAEFAKQGQTVADLQTACRQLEQEIEAAKITLAAQAQEVASGAQAIADMEVALEAAQSQNMAALLAQNLSPGEPCPVCGSAEHPRQAEVAASGQVEQLRGQLGAARAQAEKQRSLYDTSLAALDSRKKYLLEQGAALAVAKEELQIAGEKVEQQAHKLPQAWLGAASLSVLEQAREHAATLDGGLSARREWQLELDKNKQALADSDKFYHEQKQAVALLRQAGATHQAELDRLSERQKTLQKLLNTEAKRLADCKVALNEADLLEASDRYQKQDERVTELEKLVEQDQQERENALAAVRECESTINALAKRQSAAETEYRLQQERLELLEEELTRLTHGSKAAVLQAAAQAALAELNMQVEATQQALEEARSQLTGVQQKQSAAVEAVRLADTELQHADAALAKTLAGAQFASRALAEQALSWTPSVIAWQEQVDAYKERRQILQERKERLTTLLAGQRIADADWQSIVSEAQATDARHLAAVEALATAQAALANVEERNKQWLELEDERQQAASQQDLLIELVSLLRANALVEFMAGEHLDTIADIATDWLALLTGQRYALEVAPDGGFLIRDDGNGGAKRPVSTLSGGETFLTALALALALSSQVQLRGKHRLEFFFLDEGFGSLDPQLLEVVMGCLERMQGQAMSIGIISHVPELKERVLRQVLVEPAEQGGRGSRVQVLIG